MFDSPLNLKKDSSLCSYKLGAPATHGRLIKIQYIVQTLHWDTEIQPRIVNKTTETRLNPSNFQIVWKLQLVFWPIPLLKLSHLRPWLQEKSIERINNFLESLNRVKVATYETKTFKCAVPSSSLVYRQSDVICDSYLPLDDWDAGDRGLWTITSRKMHSGL